MKTVAIIAEYNPFHLGHHKQLRLIRQQYGAQTAIVCLMSGNFVQRGAPAAFDKWVRSRAAVACGANLVLELPVTKALSSAEGFAQGGVEILDQLGMVDALCFGSEHGDAQALLETAGCLLEPEFDPLLRLALKDGVSYAAARERVLVQMGGDGSLLRRPNDILAVEYCKAILRRGSRIEPVTVHRQGSYHAQAPDPENPSATSLRMQMAAGQDWTPYVPPAAAALFAQAARYTPEAGERAVLARLRTLSAAEFQALPFGAEGLWSKVQKACLREQSVEAILESAKSKRYARSRLNRMLQCAYLGITEGCMKQPAPYVRALAFDGVGRQLLRRAKDGSLPVVNAGQTPPDAAYWQLECRAADLFELYRADGLPRCGTEQAGRIYYRHTIL